MNSTKMDDICCKDIISNLPEDLICHILSFIPTIEASLTSLLSKKWRYLFAFTPNLDFDDSICRRLPMVDMNKNFMDFVDRVLGLQGNSTIDRFSLKCGNGIYRECISRWISNVIERGVSELDLRGTLVSNSSMPSSVFLSKSLVKLKIDTENEGDTGLLKLISGCHVLEELTMIHLWWGGYWNRSVSSKTLKRLTLASINLRMRHDQRAHASYGDLVVNAKNLFIGISNVQILKLFSNTLEVLTFCCEPIPVFKNLIHLTLETDKDVGWESLPALLKNCPILETLVFKGLHHKHTIKCEDADGCLCKSSKEICSCLSSSPVKVLKILKFGEVSSYFDDEEKQLELVKYFLETMPNLEQMILCYNTRIDEGVKSQLERLVPRVSSSKCSVQLICDNFIAPTYPFYGIVPAPSYPVYGIPCMGDQPILTKRRLTKLLF
ncbi:unnamed protein product [Arabidopsis lyrata]|nr:unnamed protein product [Arabidopsis lyrata]